MLNINASVNIKSGASCIGNTTQRGNGMSVEWREWTDPDIGEKLKRVVGQYLRNEDHHYIKIGITSDPQQRWDNGYSDSEWDKMIVICKTNCKECVRRYEDLLIDFVWHQTQTECFSCNENRGGGGPAGPAPYYLYIVLAKKKPSDCGNIVKK